MTRSVMMVLPYALNTAVGGVQRSTLQMGQYLCRTGWRVSYVSLRASGHKLPNDVQVISPETDMRSCSDQSLLKFIRKAVESQQPDVVFNQVGFPRQPALALHQLRQAGHRFKLIACFRNSPAFYRDNVKHSGPLQRLTGGRSRLIPGGFIVENALTQIHRLRAARRFKQAIKHCDRLMLLAPSYVDDLRWYLPDLQAEQVVVIPNAYKKPTGINLASKKNHLLYVGRIHDHQKNVMMLPELWKRVRDELRDWEFHIVGDGPDKKKLLSMFHSMDDSRVFIHDRQRAESFFEKAKIFLMTSSYEGFANTLIEAQLHGAVPVAFRSFSALDWMVNDGKNAILAPAYDLDVMASRTVALAENSEDWYRLAKAAIDNADRFSEERVGEHLNRVLNALLSDDQSKGLSSIQDFA